MKKTIKVSELKPNPNNPRIIKDDKFKKLVNSIKEFPEMLDARPVVVTPDMVVLGGNMRLKALQAAGVKETPVYVASWDEVKQKQFIIKDNVGFGEWDWNMISNEWELENLESWGLDIPNLDDEVDELEDGEEIELPQSVQLEPPKEYILIMTEPNSVEWEDLKETLKLKMVRRGGYKKGSGFDAVSLERVLEWSDLKNRINADSSTK